MKAPQQRSKPTDTDAKDKPGNKMLGLKPGKYSKKSAGNVVEKCISADAQSYAGSKIIATKIPFRRTSFMVAPFSNSTNLLAQPPNHSGKMKLQFFPIDEAIQNVLQQENHNPYLELTLAPRKKMSSIVQHLNTKWGRSSCAKGDLMLFPYNAKLDSIVGSEKWTLKDSCTAGDVYVAVGSPSTFRLRYGWFEPNLKQQSSVTSLASAHSAEKTIGDKPLDPFYSEQKQMANLSEFSTNFVRPSACSAEKTICDKHSDPFASKQKQLVNLSEFRTNFARPSAHSEEKTIGDKPSDTFSSEQKQMANLSKFPANFARPSVESNTEQNVLDNQSKVTPLSWIDCISNISFGALLSEAVPSQDNKQLPSQSNSIFQQLPATCDSFDAAIASLIAKQQTTYQPKASNPSVWDAEETCHAFPSKKQVTLGPSNSSAITSSILGAIPESDTDGDQHCGNEGRKEEPRPQIPGFGNNNDNVKPDVSMPESTGGPELAAFCSRLFNGTDSLGLSGLLANSLDAFPNFSVS